MDDMELVLAATQARQQAYVPYSKFRVGAALITADGSLYTGCNIENASYGLTCCAERTTIFKAVSDGHRRIVQLAVVADTDGPVSPCGACRQVIVEFGPEVRILLANLKGDLHVTSASKLLPGAFGPQDLLKEK